MVIGLRIDHSAKGEASNTPFKLPSDLPERLDAACEAAGIHAPLKRKAFRGALDAAARHYCISKTAPPAMRSKELRRKLRKLNETVEALAGEIDSLPADVARALDGLSLPALSEGDVEQTVLDRVSEELLDLSAALEAFDQAYRPPRGRRANMTLESALMIIREPFAQATGEELRARFDKPSGDPPVFVSPAGRAVRDFLVGLDPALNELTVANMAEKLRSKGPSRSDEEALEAPGLVRALDASLLRGRKDVIGL